jgi:bifunctional UDP-N-acetylglucosamine pyrophosphorylase / glucosamine-1-phosphate N-acetyltransferase
VPDSLTAVLVLATGDDDRMASRSGAKVLHGFAGRTLLGHVLAAVKPLSPAATVVLVGERGEQVTAHLAETASDATATSDPARAAQLLLNALPETGAVLALAGDAPLLTTGSIGELVAAHTGGTTAATELADGDGNAVGWAIDAALFREVARARNLADLGAAVAKTGPVGSAPAAAGRVHDRVQLGAAHRAYNARLLETHMRAGVTVVDPATTWIDADVTLEPDVTLWPSVELHGSTAIGTGACIGPDTSLTDTTVGPGARLTRTVAIQAKVGAGATVGPFAYLRPGTELADNVHIGTYVELKNATVGEGTKIPHLTYVGDATIGEHSNIGAATVFVNYDGVEKHRTIIGSHVRTGADNMFVAPVEIGDGAYTAAGSVITQDVPPGAMGVGRAQQRNVAGWVARKRPGTPAADAAARALERQED